MKRSILKESNNNYLLVNNKPRPLINLNFTTNNIPIPIPIQIDNYNQTPTRKPQYGESKYTSSLYVGKMHKLLRG
jgi:hypothetical protein